MTETNWFEETTAGEDEAVVNEAPKALYCPSPEEINERRYEVQVTRMEKVREVFPQAAIDFFPPEMPSYHKPVNKFIHLDERERYFFEEVTLFYMVFMRFITKNILDFTYEDLVALYQHTAYITYGEETFYKYETILRIAHGMKP